MMTLMSDPVVLSSGHVFDRTTVYDGSAFRFQACPMTRAPIEQRAYPLVYLKVAPAPRPPPHQPPSTTKA
eukprot:4880795-Prymnesium_polylepis.1